MSSPTSARAAILLLAVSVMGSSQDIAHRHRDHSNNKVIMVLGKAGRGKSSLIKAITGATQTSDEHVLRKRTEGPDLRVAGDREDNGVKLFKVGGAGAGDAAESTQAIVNGAMTWNTSVVETSFHQRYRDNGDSVEGASLVVIDTPGINDAGCIPASSQPGADGITQADTFIGDIIKDTMHVNNSYGGFDRFILTIDARENRTDPNVIACIRQLAHTFGSDRPQSVRNVISPELTEAEKIAFEARFMRNLSIVFTHADTIFARKEVGRKAGIQKVLNTYEEIIKRNCAGEGTVNVAQRIKLVHNVPNRALRWDHEVNEIPCYFVDNESVRVRQRTDAELEQEVDQELRLSGVKDTLEARDEERQELQAKVPATQQQFDLTCESIRALKSQLQYGTNTKQRLSPAAVSSAIQTMMRKWREEEARANEAAREASRLAEAARVAGDSREYQRQQSIAAEQRATAAYARKERSFWCDLLMVILVPVASAGAAVGGFVVGRPAGAAVAGATVLLPVYNEFEKSLDRVFDM